MSEWPQSDAKNEPKKLMKQTRKDPLFLSESLAEL
jgi:hypothetical protein